MLNTNKIIIQEKSLTCSAKTNKKTAFKEISLILILTQLFKMLYLTKKDFCFFLVCEFLFLDKKSINNRKKC